MRSPQRSVVSQIVSTAFVLLIGALGLIDASHATASSITFGPQSFAAGSADGGGTRANFDVLTPATLAPGLYRLTNFSFEAAQAGDAVPVLATVSGGAAGSGAETYTIIAVGNDTTVTATGMNSVAESALFTVPTGGETVYAGFVNESAQPVAFTGPTNPISPPGTDSHFNPGDNILDGMPVMVGNTFVENGGTGNASTSSNGAYELQRVYQFSETVSAVPEPSSIIALVGLCGMGLIGVNRYRRRKVAASFSAVAAIAVLICSLSVEGNKCFAAPILTENSNNAASAYPVSSTDLLEGLTPTANNNGSGGSEGTATDLHVLTNGVFTPGVNNTDTYAIGNSTITYNLGSAPFGYIVSNINTFSSWRDSGRVNQDYTVSYSTVAAPTVFVPITAVNYDPGSTKSVNTTEVLISSGSGPLATGVEDIQFVFSGVQNGYVGYNEFDVVGQGIVPEPSSIVALVGLCGMGLVVGLVRYRRRSVPALAMAKALSVVLVASGTVGIAFLASSDAAQAGTITSRNFSGDADSGISSTNNYVLAADLAGSGPLTINGVTFTPQTSASGGMATGSNGAVGYVVTIPGFSTFTNNGNNLTGNINALDQTFYYSSNGGTAAETVTFTGLTANTPYKAVFYNVGFGGAGNRTQEVYDDQLSQPTSENYDENANGSGNGSLLIDSFIPTSSTFTIDITSTQGNASFHEYGFSLQAVPEPSSIVALVGLCGMGLVGMIRYRRRKAA